MSEPTKQDKKELWGRREMKKRDYLIILGVVGLLVVIAGGLVFYSISNPAEENVVEAPEQPASTTDGATETGDGEVVV